MSRTPYKMLISPNPLSLDTVRQVAPAVFAPYAAESVSEKYSYYSTGDVLEQLTSQGYEVFGVGQMRSRRLGRVPFAKHMLRLRHPEHEADDDFTPELILINSHDATSAYRLLAGVFRMACLNGIIVGDTDCDIRVRHTGDQLQNVLDGVAHVVQHLPQALAAKRLMASKQVSLKDQGLLARAALSVRWPDEPRMSIAETLHVRRASDTKADLWTIFNVIQENITQGGFSGPLGGDHTAPRRKTSVRKVSGLDSNVAINRQLWNLAFEAAQTNFESLRAAHEAKEEVKA